MTNTAHFRIDRSIATAPDRLWHLLTDPTAREAWGAPSDDAVLVLETADLRVGGQERHRCGPAEAPEFVVDTHWYHLEAPALACFTESVSVQGHRIAVTLVTYGLSKTDSGTDLVVEVALSSLTGEEMTDDFKGGWTSGLDRLERLIMEEVLQ